MIGDFNSASLAFGNSFYNSVIPCSVIAILLFPALLRILFEQCVSSLRTLRCSQTALFPNSFFSCFITAMSSQISLRILIRGFFKRFFWSALFSVCARSTHILRLLFLGLCCQHGRASVHREATWQGEDWRQSEAIASAWLEISINRNPTSTYPTSPKVAVFYLGCILKLSGKLLKLPIPGRSNETRSQASVPAQSFPGDFNVYSRWQTANLNQPFSEVHVT